MKKPIFSSTALLAGFLGLTLNIVAVAQQPDQLAVFVSQHAPKPEVCATQAASSISTLLPGFKADRQAAAFEELEKYVAANLSYPEKARENGIEGTVKVLVEISAEGKVSPIRFIESPGFGCDEAVLDLIEKMPAWQPGKKCGLPVKTKQVLEFTFNLK